MNRRRRSLDPSAWALTYQQIYALIVTLLLLAGCDAPRLNPLDPENPGNLYHRLNGRVETVSLPRLPLDNVTVTWRGYGVPAFTGSDGRYSIETIGMQDNWIIFEKSGFFPDSDFIAWEDRKIITTDIFLNAIPVLDSLNLYSVILNRYPSLQTEQAVIEARITDPDNDLDSVSILAPTGTAALDLPYNTGSKLYERTLSVFDLGVDRLDNLAGYPFHLTITDLFRHKLILPAGSIARVIRDEVYFLNPSGNEITGQMPTLTWEVFTPGFNFTYTLEIFTADLNPQLQWRRDQIDMSTGSFQVDTPLPPGPCFWVVWAVDDFGNRTRSKPASFTVESSGS